MADEVNKKMQAYSIAIWTNFNQQFYLLTWIKPEVESYLVNEL